MCNFFGPYRASSSLRLARLWCCLILMTILSFTPLLPPVRTFCASRTGTFMDRTSWIFASGRISRLWTISLYFISY